jgi:ParB-like chromosome segregation protein Spo0J
MTASTARSTPPADAPFAVVWRRVEELQSDSKNRRRYSSKQVRRLAKSIDAFGFNVPILIDRGLRIVAGHARLLGARELGWSEVPTILTDHLSDAQGHVFVIAGNRLGEAASWDDLLLAMHLKELSAAEVESGIKASAAVRSKIDLGIGALGEPRKRRRRVGYSAGPAPRPSPRKRSPGAADE